MTVRNIVGQGQGTVLSWLAGLFVVLTLALSGCTPLYSNHGYMPTAEDLALIKVGTDTRDSVSATIGRPAAEGLLGDQAWYYVQSRWRTIGPAEPVEISREVVAISFDQQGFVENIERFGLEQGQIVPLSRRITTANVKGRGILTQIFSNIGKLNTDNLLQ
jgi:outer membrane protein assembly factor BamE (lipoprotein component of BamABCDE complex)